MSKTVLILFAACVGLSLLSLHLVKQMRAGQETIGELQAQLDSLRQQQQTPPPPRAPEPEVTPFTPVEPEPVASIAPAKQAPSAIAVRPAEPAPPDGNVTVPSRDERLRMMRESRERQRQLMQDPEYREALRVQHRSNMSRQYPGLAQELGLSADQTEQLFNLLADQQMRSNEMLEPMWDMEGADPAAVQQRREKMQQQWAEMQRKSEAEIAAQLGSEKLQAWKEYQSTLGSRHQAEQYRASLASQGVPLSDEANRAVVKALAEAQKAEMQEYANQARATPTTAGGKAATWSARGPTAEGFERQLEFTKRRNQRVLDALSPYLTYEQRQAVEKEQEAQIKMQEAQIRIMRAQSKTDGENYFFNAPGAMILQQQ